MFGVVGSECGRCCACTVGDSCVCGRQSQERGRSVELETIVSVGISCDSGIAMKIFTHESATTAENRV